jgi:NADH dehydrogenase
MKANILVLGGGFAGLAAVRELAGRARRPGADLHVRLVDRRSHAVFSPLLPDLISGRVNERAMTHPLAEHCRAMGVEFTQAEARAVDPVGRRVDTDEGTFGADAIIMCMGCETNYFGNADLAMRAPGLKDVGEGRAIRERALAVVTDGSPERPALLVVGGGYTGFEVASQLAVLASRALQCSYDDLAEVCQIVIVEKLEDVLRGCSAEIRAWSLELIRSFGVQVRTGVSLESYGDDGAARLSDGTEFGRALAVWCAGVTPGATVAELDTPRVPGNRLAVDEYLRLPGSDRVFAAGDVAGAMPGGAERPIRLSVQFSLVGGRCAARNAVRSLEGKPLRPFTPRDLGYVVPLAPGKAAGEVLGMSVHGRLPNLLHYLMSGFRSWSWTMRRALISDLWRARSRAR